MIGLDTNILLRYLLQDDPAQAAIATRAIELLSTENQGFISLVAVVETVFALRRIYGFSAVETAYVVQELLQNEALSIQNDKDVFAAMVGLKSGKCSFHDALMGSLGRSAGCDHTLTFDRKATRLPGFVLVS